MIDLHSRVSSITGSLLHPVWDLQTGLDVLFQPLFRICIYLIVLLPSGTLFHINFKLLFFALVFPSALYRMIRIRRISLLHLGLLLMVPTVLLFWILIGQVYQVPFLLSILEYRDIMITLVSTWLIGVAIGGDDQRSRIRFLRTVLHAEIAACVLKLGLISYALARGIQISVLVDTISEFSGAKLMGADFAESSQLGRVQFVADGLIPLCLFVLMRFRDRLRVGPWTAFVMFVLLFASLVLTFSRYFWAFAGFALILGILFGKRDRFYAFLLTGFTLLFLASLPIVVPIAVLRFSADVAGGSDDVRGVQITAMQRYFWDAPLLGHGLGSHTGEVVRSQELPYVYEVQLLALAGQIGILGFLFLGAVGAYYFYALIPWNRPWRGPLVGIQLSTSILVLVWIAAGLFNPMLLNSAAAVSYGLLKAMGEFEEPSAAPLAGQMAAA